MSGERRSEMNAPVINIKSEIIEVLPKEIKEMSEYDVMKKELEHRKEFIGPILPGANWVTVKGNFTPNELRKIADQVDSEFAKIIR